MDKEQPATTTETTAPTATTAATEKPGIFARLCSPSRHSFLRVMFIGVIGGIIIWGGLNIGMEYTNRSEFCISCHEMTIPFEELKKTAHYKNRSGAAAQCSDCHVASSKHPADYMFKSFQKLMAARDVIGHITGIVDTPEKFEAHRMIMAQRVWDRMKERDSKECRNCHSFENMDPTKQKDRSVVKHEGAREDGKTCIECHKGVSHQLPREMRKAEPVAAAAPAPVSPTAEAPKAEAAAPVAEAPKAEAAPAGAAPAAPAAAAAAVGPDWSKVAKRNIKLFYPGQASVEWVLNKPDHSSASDITDKKRPCAKCHEGDADDVGNKIVAGKPVGVAGVVIEPNPIADKAGFIPVNFQTTHDGSKIYFRFEWTPPKTTGTKLDSKNEVKLSMMFDGGGTVDLADQAGCWGTCHTDLRSMKDAADDKKTKYIKGADLASGKFMDLIQFKSGDKKPVDGYVADTRVMDGGKGLVSAEGKKEGNKWVVTFVRDMAGGGKGDHKIVPGKVFNFGFAIHESFTNARFHYVSLGYQFGLDKAAPDVKNYINVVKQ